MRRTFLFLPGNSPKMLLNGAWLPSDCLIFDLEDAVSPDEKDAARILVRNAVSAVNYGKREIVIRINSLDTPYWEDDLKAVLPLKPAMVLLPKVDGSAAVDTLDRKMSEIEEGLGISPGTTKIGAQIETAAGVEKAYEIGSVNERITALFLGAEDLTADLRSARTKEGAEIAYARGRLVNAARACGIEVYDTPFTDMNDLDGLEKDALLARKLGFSGKLVISPRHLDAVNAVFSPSEEEIQYARDVFQAIEEGKKLGKGAVSLRGKMIDAPVVKRAERILQMAADMGEGASET